MKLTITDDNKEAGPDVVFVGITIFASIVGLLNKLHCLPRDAEQRNGAVLPQQDVACHHSHEDIPGVCEDISELWGGGDATS